MLNNVNVQEASVSQNGIVDRPGIGDIARCDCVEYNGTETLRDQVEVLWACCIDIEGGPEPLNSPQLSLREVAGHMSNDIGGLGERVVIRCIHPNEGQRAIEYAAEVANRNRGT